jgi:hypothetical protein
MFLPHFDPATMKATLSKHAFTDQTVYTNHTGGRTQTLGGVFDDANPKDPHHIEEDILTIQYFP